MRRVIAFALTLFASACASAPPKTTTVAPRPPATVAPAAPVLGLAYDQKVASILRLEDQRVLGDSPLDLTKLAADANASIRRRAALAIGHVQVRESLRLLVALLTDPEPEVRQMAAFGLGLLGAPEAKGPLTKALADPSPLVQGSAAEALGLIGDAGAAPGIGQMLKRIAESGAVAAPPHDDDDVRRDTPTAAFRLGLFALARLKAFDELAAVVLDEAGQPKLRWWPVAYALQLTEHPGALKALTTLAGDPHPYTRAFAVTGLGGLKNPAAVPLLVPLAAAGRGTLAVQAVRALGRIGNPTGAPPILKLIEDSRTEPHVRLEAVTALGSIRAPGVFEILLDVLTDPSPSIRAAALRSVATVDPEGFVAVLASLDPDPNWTVRAVMAEVLGTLPAETALPRLNGMLNDVDQRVVPTVIQSLVKLKAPLAEAILLSRITADDAAVRAAAAEGLGEMRFPSGVRALENAFAIAQRDGTYAVRAAAMTALAKFGLDAARLVLTAALGDRDWTMRLRAAKLMKQLDPSSADAIDRQIRPAPIMLLSSTYQQDRIVRPRFSPRAFIDTDRGTIQIDLAVLDAPLTVENFVTLARRGFFDGVSIHRVVADFVLQGGDPRGDGEGGPGYSVRDEFNQRSFLRGSVGMALELWPESGGSQFFITHSPQPQLDAKYTVFGHVTGGMEVADSLQQWDVIRRVRIWDGTETPADATGER